MTITAATTDRVVADKVGQVVPLQGYNTTTSNFETIGVVNGAVPVVLGSAGGANAATALAAFLVAGGAAQTGTAISFPSGRASFQAVANGSSGEFAATVTIKVSNNNTNWETMGTITLSGTATTAASGGFTSDAPWAYVRSDVSGFSGTGATCNVMMVI